MSKRAVWGSGTEIARCAAIAVMLITGCDESANVPQRPFDGFWQAGTLRLAPETASGDAPAWTIRSGGEGVVLVMFRSDVVSHASADNEELVVQLTGYELASRSAVPLDTRGRIVRYQRGAQKLSYASTTLKGSLTARREAEHVRGQVTLTATAPSINLGGGSGEVAREFAFDLEPK